MFGRLVLYDYPAKREKIFSHDFLSLSFYRFGKIPRYILIEAMTKSIIVLSGR